MALEQVGVKAVVDGLTGYLSASAQIDKANQSFGKSADAAAKQVATLKKELQSLEAVAAGSKSGIGGQIAQARVQLKELETQAAATKAEHQRLADVTQGRLNIAFAAVAGVTALAAGAFVAATIRAAAFEAAMAGIQAVSGATATQMTQLSAAAMTAGTAFGFTATESASGIEALIKAGVSVADVVGGALPAALTLAAAGGVEVGQAAEIAANAMNVFSLKGSDMAHIADVVAGAANASAIDVNDFRLSIQQAGAVAATAGISFDSTAQAIAVMGSAGIKSSDAGTSLKTMLQNLQPQSKDAADLMKFLGLMTKDGANAFFDAEGKAKSFRDIADVLHHSLSGLTEQQKLATLSILFGSDAARAASVMAREGAAGFDDMADAMGKVSAEDVANKRLNSLEGDLQKLKVALDGVAIKAGKETTPAMRDLVQQLKIIVDNVAPNVVTASSNIVTGLDGIARFAAAATGSVSNLGKALSLLGPLIPGLAAAGAALQVGSALLTPSQVGVTSTGASAADIGAGFKDAQARAKALARPLQNFSDLQASADGVTQYTKALGSASDAELEAQRRLDAFLASLRDGKGGGGGVAKSATEAKTALQEYGIGLDDVRRAGEMAKLSQETIDAAILALGGTALDTGVIVDGFGKSVTRLAAGFNAAGLDGNALVAQLQAINAETKAAAEADKAMAKAKQEQADAERKAKEDEAERQRQAKEARDQVVADITGASARDVLGGLRSRTPKDATTAAADFNAAAAGLDAVAKAGLATDVAISLMETRLGNLAAGFSQLTGDDLASAGATTDAIRKLIDAFKTGTIGVEEFSAGMQKYSGELGRLGAVVDTQAAAQQAAWEKEAQGWRDYEKAQADALKTENLDRNREASAAWASAIEDDSKRSQFAWQKSMEEMAAAADKARVAVQQLITINDVLYAQTGGADAASGREARAAAATFNNSVKAGMSPADIATALQSALEGANMTDVFQLIFFGGIQQALMRAGITIAPNVGQSLGSAIAGALGIESFGDGGMVGGPRGQARLIMAHGGETVVPGGRPDMVALPYSAQAGGNVDRSVSYVVNASYTRPQDPQSIRYDLTTLRMLSGR